MWPMKFKIFYNAHIIFLLYTDEYYTLHLIFPDFLSSSLALSFSNTIQSDTYWTVIFKKHLFIRYSLSAYTELSNIN